MSEELYLRYEMKYRDHMNRKVDEKVREYVRDVARTMLVNGRTIELVCDVTKLPCGEVLRIKDELDRKAV